MDEFIGMDGEGEVDEIRNEALLPSFGLEITHASFRSRSFRKLSLLNTWGVVNCWSEFILGILLHNPKLQHLNVSVSQETVWRMLKMGWDSSAHYAFFKSLCEEYSKHSKEPLRLKSIRLGNDIRFPQPEECHGVVDFNALEEVYVFNKHPKHLSSIPWALLSPSVTPNLRQIHIPELDTEVWDKLPEIMSGRPMLTRPMGFRADITYGTSPQAEFEGKSDYNLYKLPPEVPMIVTSSPVWGLSGPFFRRLRCDIPGSDRVTHISLKLAARRRSLVDAREPSVLQDWQFKPALCLLVSELSSLKALRIMDEVDDMRNTPFTRHDVQQGALTLAQASPTLRYFRVGKIACRIHRRESIEEPIQIEDLDEWEDEIEGPAIFHEWR